MSLAWTSPFFHIFLWPVPDIQVTVLTGLLSCPVYIGLLGSVESHFLVPQDNLSIPDVFSFSYFSPIRIYAPGHCLSHSPLYPQGLGQCLAQGRYSEMFTNWICTFSHSDLLLLVVICHGGTVGVIIGINESWALKYNKWLCQIRALGLI